ncbi:MAG TPA: peptide deformylase [Candidatus Limnocylindrales bacterium]|nr:peptide deformylase [Candidatus Limnocylindrales bacterium]
MSIRPIVTLGDPVLRLRGAPVTRFDRALGQLLDDMLETMRAAPGVGLAAQQIGLALQVCVIEVEDQVHELINPRIVRLSGDQTDLEGCLSLPGYWAERTRAATATVEAQNRHGRPIRLTGSGLLARAIQHELGHLEGQLYIDELAPDASLISNAELDAMIEARKADGEGVRDHPAAADGDGGGADLRAAVASGTESGRTEAIPSQP